MITHSVDSEQNLCCTLLQVQNHHFPGTRCRRWCGRLNWTDLELGTSVIQTLVLDLIPAPSCVLLRDFTIQVNRLQAGFQQHKIHVNRKFNCFRIKLKAASPYQQYCDQENFNGDVSRKKSLLTPPNQKPICYFKINKLVTLK